jgi:hypothetical protein
VIGTPKDFKTGAIISPLQGDQILITANPGWRAQDALTLGYFMSRLQREEAG